MKIKGLLAAAIAVLMCTGSALAVSDGHYDPSKMHCTGHADNTITPAAEEGCYTAIMTVADASGHEYLGAGIRQTADGDFANTLDVWFDAGQGTKTTITFDGNGPGVPVDSVGSSADPSAGLAVYFAADDNLDAGEHDSSSQVNNGPSDGGAISIAISPDSANAWLDGLSSMDPATILTNPLPVSDAGAGQCADGVCFNLASVRRIAFQGGKAGAHRDVANYDGKQFDPDTCDGPDDDVAACSDATHPNFTLKDWNDLEGTVYVEPGFQIFEDPDAQASPIGPYPIPALYVGTCGAIFGGASFDFTGAPNANDAGQLVFGTAC